MNLVEVINKTEERFRQIAPQYMNYDAEKGFAVQLLSNNQYLAEAAQTENYKYLQQAVVNVAAIGLSLNPAEKLAYLIPRNVKVGNQWQSRVYLEPSYMGMLRLATDSGSIEWAQANCVYEQDEFIDNGPGEKPIFQYKAFAKDRGEFVGVFCVAKTSKGDFLTTVMTADEINGIMARSESAKKGFGPWRTDFNEQAKKTVIRRAFKTWPRTNERRMEMLAKAVDMSNENEGFEPIVSSPNLGSYTAEQKEHYDHMIQKSDALEMYTFLTTIDDTVKTNLYHSFEKGTKGKYQNIVNSLYKKGRETFYGIIEDVNNAAFNGDDSGVIELHETMSADTNALMFEFLCDEAKEIINEIEKAA